MSRPWLGPSMAQWDQKSQPKDDPYNVCIDDSQIHCAIEFKTLSRLFWYAWAPGWPILLNLRGAQGILNKYLLRIFELIYVTDHTLILQSIR